MYLANVLDCSNISENRDLTQIIITFTLYAQFLPRYHAASQCD